jgi:hypothetical protein
VNLATQAKTSTEDLVIGTPSNDVEPIIICNRTGDAISSVSIKLSTKESFDKPLLSQAWSDGQNLQLYLTQQQTASSATNPLFDTQLTLASGAVFGINGIDLLAVKQGTLRIDFKTGLVYLEYSNGLGQTVSTIEQSVATKAAEEEALAAAEKAAAEAAAAAEAEAAAAAAAAEAEAAANAGYGYPGATGGGSGGVTQSGDTCFDNIQLR